MDQSEFEKMIEGLAREWCSQLYQTSQRKMQMTQNETDVAIEEAWEDHLEVFTDGGRLTLNREDLHKKSFTAGYKAACEETKKYVSFETIPCDCHLFEKQVCDCCQGLKKYAVLKMSDRNEE